MPPQVSAAPVAGQIPAQQFAPRPGPAARVSQARLQRPPFVAEPPPPQAAPHSVEEEATIAEESSDGDDDQIETLVLVRDKLSLPKKQG